MAKRCTNAHLPNSLSHCCGPIGAKGQVLNKAHPAAACGVCGGWTAFGGMSQHHRTTTPVMGRFGCVCNADDEYRRHVSDAQAAEMLRLAAEHGAWFL